MEIYHSKPTVYYKHPEGKLRNVCIGHGHECTMPVILSNNEAVNVLKLFFCVWRTDSRHSFELCLKILNLITRVQVLTSILKDDMKSGIIIICISPCN